MIAMLRRAAWISACVFIALTTFARAQAPAVPRVDTYAAQKALIGGQYSVLFRSGYLAAGDGGSGYFIWSPGSSCADDIYTCVQPNSGSGRWTIFYLTQIAEKCAVAQGSAISLTSNVPANVCSTTLPPGTWIVSGTVSFTPSVGTTNIAAGINTTSATFPILGVIGPAGMFVSSSLTYPSASAAQQNLGTGTAFLITQTASTTVYLVVGATFASGTCTAYGGLYALKAP